MKNRTTLLLVCFLVVLAQGQDIVNWAGNWDQKSTASDTACYPANSILIVQNIGNITASWTWANSAPCTAAGLSGKQFNQTVATPSDNSISIQLTVSGAVINGTFTVTGDNAVFASSNGASSTYARRSQLANWPGVWSIVSQNSSACNPENNITITQSSYYVSASWVWANTQPCIDAGLATKTFTTSVSTPSGNAVALSFTVGTATVAGIFAVVRDQAVFASVNGASAIFSRNQQLVNWLGVWDVYSTYSSSACYPDSFITIVPNGSNITASWVWANTKPCTEFGLAGQAYNTSQPLPKGNAIFLDFFVGGAYVSGLFTTSGDSSTFTSSNGASANFNRRSQMVNWAGVFDIASTDSTVCSPDGSITVSQTSSNITVSWTWAKTSACVNLGLSGQAVSKTVNTPSGSSVTLDASSVNATVSVLLTVYLDGAVFSSTTGASSAAIRRQENAVFAGTWILLNSTSGSCYPNTSIVITQGNGNITANWTWNTETYCNWAGLSGKNFSQTEVAPRGSSVFIDTVVNSARVTGLFTVNGNNATFASSTGASATFYRKVDPTKSGSWTGIIVAIIVIVAIAVVGYFYIQQRNKKLEELNNSTSGVYSRA